MVTIAFVADRLAGRGDELALLAALVSGVSAGIGGVVLVEGEQGIGKSSVLRAGLAGAEAAGCRVLIFTGFDPRMFPVIRLLRVLRSPGARSRWSAVHGPRLSN